MGRNPPVTVLLDLPLPPSVNQLWRFNRKRVHPSARYERWKDAADKLAMAQCALKQGFIRGRFIATVQITERVFGKIDLDNLPKALLDWAQSRNFVVNDKLNRRLIAEWVPPETAPEGCRLILTEVSS